MTNEFYKLLLNEKWVWKKWNGPKQLEDKKTHSLMMLPTDYVLTQDKSFKKWVKAYADDEDLWFKECVPSPSLCRSGSTPHAGIIGTHRLADGVVGMFCLQLLRVGRAAV